MWLCRTKLREKLYDEQCRRYEAAIQRYTKEHEEDRVSIRTLQEEIAASVKVLLCL